MQRTHSKTMAQIAAPNDTTAKGKGYFVGSPCTLCADAQWKTDSRSLR